MNTQQAFFGSANERSVKEWTTDRRSNALSRIRCWWRPTVPFNGTISDPRDHKAGPLWNKHRNTRAAAGDGTSPESLGSGSVTSRGRRYRSRRGDNNLVIRTSVARRTLRSGGRKSQANDLGGSVFLNRSRPASGASNHRAFPLAPLRRPVVELPRYPKLENPNFASAAPQSCLLAGALRAATSRGFRSFAGPPLGITHRRVPRDVSNRTYVTALADPAWKSCQLDAATYHSP